MKRTGLLIIGMCLIQAVLFAQTGPGGIGNSTSNQFWYKADGITGVSGGASLTAWPDQSGNGLTAGQHTGALEFDGTDDEANVAYKFSVTGTFTMEAWIWPFVGHQVDAQSATGTDGMSGQRYPIFPENGYGAWANTLHAGAGISMGTNGISVYEHTAGILAPVLVYSGSLSGWTHVAVVYQSGSAPVMYVHNASGTLLASVMGVSGNRIVHPSGNFGGGAYGHFQGRMDEVRIWNTARTLTQISSTLQTQVLGETGLIGNWSMDEGSGTVTDDATGLAGDATLRNGPLWAPQQGSLTYGTPVYTSASAGLNSKPVVCFNGSDSRMELPGGGYNTAAASEFRAISMAFTLGDAGARQVLYEEGGSSKGLNIYVVGGSIYAGAWNTSLDDTDPNARLPWGYKYLSAPVTSGNPYILTLVYDYNGNKVEVFLNGTSLGVASGVGKLYAHSPGTIGFTKDGTRYHDFAVEGTGSVFTGCIAEIASYGSLNTAERKIVENYLAAKYDLTISDDLYAYEFTHRNDLGGMGRDNASNSHLSAVSDLLSLSRPSLADGDYALLGHDNASTVTYIDASGNAPPNVLRMLRTWRLDLGGQVRTLGFTVPQSSIQSFAGYQKPVVLLDNDGNFQTGCRVVVLNASGSNYTLDNVPVLDGDYISLGILNQYQHIGTYAQGVDALGQADMNYTDPELNASGLWIKNPSGLSAGEYLLAGHDNGDPALASSNTPASHIVRTGRIWKINAYGDPGQVIVEVDPAVYTLPAGKDTWVLLIDRNHDGNFSDAEAIGMVQEGHLFKAYYQHLSEGDLIAVGAGVAASNSHYVTNSPVIFDQSAGELSSLTSKQLFVRDANDFDYATPCSTKVKKAVLNLLFHTGEDYIFGANAFSAQVQVQVKGYGNYNASGTPLSIYTTTLDLNNQQPEILYFLDVTDDYLTKGVKSYDVKVTSYTPSSLSLLNSNLVLKAFVEKETETFVPLTEDSDILTLQYQTSGKSVTFSWSTDRCNAPFYQFQLMRLFNTQDPPAADEHSIVASPDWSQALTLETSNTSVTLTMAEGTGYYAWRVRPMGNYYEGGVADSRNWGTWSTVNIPVPDPLTLTCTGSDLATCLADYKNSIFYFEQFDQDKNFIYSRAFTEDTRIHEGISYANGLLQVKQTQSRINANADQDAGTADGAVIASQSVYDFSGRAALSTMAAPVLDSDNELGYRTGLLKTSSGLYGPQNFDDDSKIQAPDPVDPVNGGWINFYYSDNNTYDPNIPSAENYPFSRVVFDNEGNNRTIESSGPGLAHKMGGGHTMKVQYGSVSDEELIRVFGDEAPDAASVYKVATTDQNGITSLQYIDKEGKTIATCLAGSNIPTNLTPLESETESAFSVQEELNKNVPYGESGLLATKALTFTEPTDVTISYEITPAIIYSYCGDYCTTCGYKLKIKIIDLNNASNNQVLTSPIAPGTVKDISAEGACSAAALPVDLSEGAAGNELHLSLAPGKYIIEKIIEPDLDAAASYALNITSKVSQILQQKVDIINGYLDDSDIEGLIDYLKGLQGAPGADLNVEVYAEDGTVLYSVIDSDGENNAILTTLPDRSVVKLVTTCCSIEVPVIYPEFDPCSQDNILTLGNYFAQYLQDNAGISISAASGGVYADGNEFNSMIQNMLNEPYYSCKKLLDAWKAAVLSKGQFGSIDIGEGIRSQDDYNNYPDWVKNQSGSPGNDPEDLLNRFFETVGYHYAGYTTDANLLKYKPYKYFYYDRSDIATNDAKNMCENAFCDYVTDYTAVPDPSTALPPCASGDMCTKTPSARTETDGSYSTLNIGTHDLTEQDYYSLKQCVNNNVYSAGMNFDQEQFKQQVQVQKDQMEGECRSECESRYPYFMEALTAMNDAAYWGADIQTNGRCEDGQGGWITTGGTACSWGAHPKELYLTLQPGNTAVSGILLNVGETYKLRFTLTTEPGTSVSVVNADTVLYTQQGGVSAKDTEVIFTSKGTDFSFVATSDGGAVILDSVFLRKEMLPLHYPYEDLCCTARQLVDYCKQSCNLTLVTSDCAPAGAGPEDRLTGVGTSAEIARWQAIMTGTFELQVPENGSCASGYEPDKLFLESYYPFNGNADDESDNEINATVFGATLDADANGMVDKAYSFDGTTSYIHCQSVNRNVVDQVTVMAWIKTTQSTTGAVISKYTTSGSGYELRITGGQMEFIGRDAGNTRTSGTNSLGLNLPAVNDGNWHHVAGVCNRGAWEVWVDGVKRSESYTAAPGLNLSNTVSFSLGRRSGNPLAYFSGEVDEVRVYSTALTKNEITPLAAHAFGIGYTTVTGNCTNPPLEKVADFTYGGHGNEEVRFFERCPDGGYLVAGSSEFSTDLSTKAGANIYLSKISPWGRVIWRKILGGNGADEVKDLVITSTKEILVAGTSTSTDIPSNTLHGSQDMYVVKLDLDGNILFEQLVGYNGEETLETAMEVTGGFVLCGATTSSDIPSTPVIGDRDGYLVKISGTTGLPQLHHTSQKAGVDYYSDAVIGREKNIFVTGEIEVAGNSTFTIFGSSLTTGFAVNWSNVYYTLNNVNVYGYLPRIEKCMDGGCLIFFQWFEAYWGGSEIAKISASGNMLWMKGTDIIKSVKELKSGEILIGGGAYSGATLLYIAKLRASDGSFSKEMNYNFYNSYMHGSFKDLAVASDGSILASGEINYANNGFPTKGGYDLYLAKFDKDLSLQWDKNFGGAADELGGLLLTDPDGSVSLAATTGSTTGPDSDLTSPNHSADSTDVWVVRLDYRNSCNPRQVCIKWIPPAEAVAAVHDPAPVIPDFNTTTITTIRESVSSQMQQCKADNEAALLAEYKKQCGDRNSLNDHLVVSYGVRYHHYTLYYHDRAGNLVKTVPPEGVQFLDLTDPAVRNRSVHPAHTLVTTCRYNSLGQLVEQSTPDGGMTAFQYNSLGQLRFSQNARQAAMQAPRYSYTKYDYLGRSIESGQADLTGSFAGLGAQLDVNPLGPLSFPVSGTSEETYMVYSDEAGEINYLGQGQRYLQNRVSYTYTRNLLGEKISTFYSYDPHGNVEWLVQELPGLSRNYIGYEYDLISNKVTKVKYNETLPDQFFHRYEYDTENRITAVYTSPDGKLWDRDEAYTYYKHGPLKRAEIGEDHIQGVDYAYTLQGWLKGMNTPALNVSGDPGNDGGTGSVFAKDEYGMALGYFAGDFVRSGSVYNSSASGGNAQNLNSSKPLYNGNITSWVSRIEQEYRDSSGTPAPEIFTTGNLFSYDHLNRLLQSDFYRYNGGSAIGSSYDASTDYRTTYTYDANGNIKTLTRKGYGAAQDMDILAYSYQEGKNRLRQVTDQVAATAYPADLDNQTDADNYAYDSTGQLVSDLQEKIRIEWTAYGKVSEVKRLTYDASAKPEIRYTYDAMGNRVRKEVNNAPYDASGNYQRIPESITTTYYVRDATGNILSVYTRNNEAMAGKPGYYNAVYKLQEQPIYGSRRAGQRTPDLTVASPEFAAGDLDRVTFDNTHTGLKTENQTQLITSHKTEVLTDATSKPQQLRTAKLQNYAGGSYSGGGDILFLGSVGNNVSSYEDANGNVTLQAVTAESYWGRANTCLVYAEGLLLPGSGGISSAASTKTVFVKRPGDNHQYYLITVDPSGHLNRSVIDMDLPGNSTNTNYPYGDVAPGAMNLPLDNGTTPYTGELQVIEDFASGKVYLYATRFVAPAAGEGLGTLELVWFAITENTISQPQVVASWQALNDNGQSEMQLSKDGKNLVLFVHKKLAGWFDHQETVMHVLPLGYDYKVVFNHLVHDDSTALGDNYPGLGGEFSDGERDRFVYYSKDLLVNLTAAAGSDRALVRHDLRNGTEVSMEGMSGDLRRQPEGVLACDPDQGTITAYQEGGTVPDGVVTATGITLQLGTGFVLNRQFAVQNHQITKETEEQVLFARKVDEKRYELTDHLGNVTVVVSDLKGATVGSTSVNNFALVKDYYNYYPFGMAMPGRNVSAGYRYGFNGMEKDDEITGVSGINYDFGARIFDARVGRWLSLDPLTEHYPSQSPYLGMGGNPIFIHDKDGRVQVDANGNIIYEVDESKKSTTFSRNGYTITVRSVFVFSNSGEKIAVDQYVVTRNIDSKEVNNKVILTSFNCHGHSVLNDKFKVGLSAEKLLKTQGGFDKDESLEGQVNKDFSKIKKGDIVVLFDQSGMVVHSFKYMGNNKVSSKNGDRNVNEFMDKEGNTYIDNNASIDDIYKLYVKRDKESGGKGVIRKGYFTPETNKIIITNSKEYDVPSNGTVRKK